MTQATIGPGSTLDGFTIGRLVHRGGMAALWSVTHPDHAMPLIMKVPRLSEGEDPAAIVSFEMEQMIMPRLSTHEQLPDLMEEEFRLPYGSAPFMAPEQVLGERRDPASDLFAVGALMFYLATGRTPFGDPQGLAGLKRHL